MVYKLQAPKILQHRTPASAEDFNSLLGKSAVAIGQIANRTLGTIREMKIDQHIVAAVARQSAHGVGLHTHNRRSGQKHQQVDKVTRLAENAPAALSAVVHPMIRRQIS